MKDLPTFYLISYIISFLGQIAVLIACIILLIKQRSLAAGLMLIGMVLHMAFSIIGLLMNYMVAQRSAEAIIKTQGIFSTLNTLSYLIFGFGLLLLAIKMAYRKKEN